MRSGLVGLILGIGLAFFLESLDNTIKTPEEAEKLMQLPIIGAIGRFKVKRLAEKGSDDTLITVRHPRSHGAEAFKTLRANLLMSYSETPHKVLLVTSPFPKDGKTTVAANLAVAMAQMERRVLLVDADLRNPTLHRLSGIDHNAGLSTLLLQEAYEENMVQQVGRDTLSLVPAGPCPPNPSEMLGSERMQRFIEVARESYDTVILDTPPIFAVSDALVASSLVDGIIVVLRSGSTPRKHARRILAPFSDLQIRQPVRRDRKDQEASMSKVLGVVMNFLEPHQGSYYYDYRYYNHNRTETEDATETAAVADPVTASSVTEHF